MLDDKHYRKLLLTAQAQIMSRLHDNLPDDLHSSVEDVTLDDNAVADEAVSTSLLLDDELTATLGQIESALRKLDDGTYGLCAVDGKPIEQRRLNALPWATLCLKHQARKDDASGAQVFTM